MSKNLNVALNFTANTSQAKSQIQELSNLLTKVAYGNNLNVNSSSIQAASKAAKELAYHLNNAYNKNTGNYDLSKLNASLIKAKTSISALSTDLVKAGTTGQQAFVKLAQTISTADQPVLRMNKHLTEMWTTLKNTARWQISSSLLHGLSGSIQSAYGYAQDLNESLTDIRIVTGQSVDQMAKFAEQANKAAKNLGTTTTKYTDAALIYYQQGLSDKDVQKRTDTTIKMANVTGENAEDVSSYMTAIWNNFDDGSKSLEYYADVITKLGAETAASSEEIANGLEKFAAVGETIGLSYEYATAALTTIIDKTRQSEDVVGTALKTIFARIQGLKEGEETEEGYDLNKYSAVLQQYGISIFDANKELKNMDTILDEMGAKWETLEKADQVYLAQTVAGVRQYTQLISLMDNWGDVQKNIASAANSDGSLQKQADIYAESWEAAKNRVRASLEAIYSDLIDDEFFIDVYNNIAEMIDGVDNFIDSIGGMKTVLLGLGTVFLSMVKTKIGPAMQNLATNITVMTGGAKIVYNKINTDTSNAINKIQEEQKFNEIQKQELINAQQLIGVKNKLNLVNKDLSDSEKAQYEMAIEGLQLQQQEVLRLIEKEKKLKEIQETKEGRGFSYSKSFSKNIDSTTEYLKDQVHGADEWRILDAEEKDKIYDTLDEHSYQAGEALQNTIFEITEAFYKYYDAAIKAKEAGENAVSFDPISGEKLYGKQIEEMRSIIEGSNDSNFREKQLFLQPYLDALPNTITQTEEFNDALVNTFAAVNNNEFSLGANDLLNIIKKSKIEGKDLEKILVNTFGTPRKEITETKQEIEDLNNTSRELKETSENIEKSLKDFNPVHIVSATEALSAFTAGLGSFAMAASSIKSLKETLENPDIDGWEKTISILMTVSMLSTSLMGVFSNLKTAYTGLSTSIFAYTVAQSASNKEKIKEILETEGLTVAQKRQKLVEEGLVITKWKLFAATSAIILAIGLLALTIYKIYTYTHDARLEFKEATKNLEDAKNAFDNVATSIENVNSALNELDGAYDTLKDLKRGSAEWYQELDKINSTMSDIIDNYGLTEGEHYFRNDELALELTKAGKDKVEEENKKRYTNARYTVNAAEFAAGYNEVEALKETIASTMRYSGTPEVYDPYKIENGIVGAPVERSNLSYDDINKIITEINANPTLDLSNQQELIEAGFSKGSANLITSNSDLQTALKDLAVKVEANTQSYAERITNTIAGDDRFSDALATMQVMQGVDIDTYGTGIIEKAGDEIAAMVHSAIESGKYRNQDLSSYEDDYAADKGYKKSGEKYYETNENGDIDLSKEVKIDDSQLEYWVAQEEAINDYLKTFNKMKDTVENSKKVWSAADKIKKGWEDGKKSLNTYRTNYDKYTKAVDKHGKDSKEALDLKQTLGKNIKEIEKYTSSIKTDFANLLGTSDDVAEKILTPEFALENEKIIEGAINGNIDDLETLGEKAALQELVIDNVNINDEAVMAEVTNLHNWLSEYDNDINLEIGANINDQEFINKCNEIILAAGMTATEAQEYFQNMGYDVKLNKGIVEVPAYEYAVEYTNEYGPFGRLIKSTPNIKEIPYMKKVTAPTIQTITPNGKGFGGNVIERSSGGGGTSVPSTPTGGGDEGSKSTVDEIDVVNSDDEVERFKEINDQLSDSERHISRINQGLSMMKSKNDILYGNAKIKGLKAINEELERSNEAIRTENALLEEKQNKALSYAETDKNELTTLLTSKGYSDFTYDPTSGNITDYTTIMTQLYNDLAAKQTAYNNQYAGQSETKESEKALEEIEAFEEFIEEVEKNTESYEDAIENYKDVSDDILDNAEEMLSNELEQLANNLEAIELKVTIAQDVKDIQDAWGDYIETKLGDDMYKSAEGAAEFSRRADSSLQMAGVHGETLKELRTKYENYLSGDTKNGISYEDYVSKSKEAYESLLSELGNVAEMDELFETYYADALSLKIEELAEYVEELGELSSVLDHYSNILKLTGQEEDYDKMGEILESKKQVLKDNKNMAKAEYKTSLALEEELEKQLSLIEDKNSEEYKMVKRNLEAQQEATEDAYEKMLTAVENYAEAANAVWENSIKKAASELEKSLTGELGFDRLKESMQNRSEIQDEYLTKTNQAYEANKLLANIQSDIDKTSNVAAKQRLNNFAEEINQLKNKGKLSKIELEIAQAKYKQLQAQIALEEAQNSKSVVRLSRDNEGNYGYVYTADQDKINEAQQAKDAADNDLYNIQLEATNKYGEKVIQAREELYQALTEIDNTYAEGSEEWWAAYADAVAEYEEKAAMYTELYGIAQQGDARVVREAWVNSYEKIIDDGGAWETAVTGYVTTVKGAYDDWKEDMDKNVEPVIGPDLESLKNKTADIKKESANLKTQHGITVKSVKDDMPEINNVTKAYGQWRDTVKETREELEKLAQEKAKELITEIQSEGDEDPPTNPADEVIQEEQQDLSSLEDDKNKDKDKDKNQGTQGDGKIQIGDKVKLTGKLSTNSYDEPSLSSAYKGKELYVQEIVDKSRKAPYHIGTSKIMSKNSWVGWVDKNQISGYDTGGYTGMWGPEGKLAMLHEKEIVLNEEDTANILKVVELVRAMIDANVATAGIGILHSPGINTQNQNLEQTVTITAEFPNATNHNEIEMAFNSLINRASQYANRK